MNTNTYITTNTLMMNCLFLFSFSFTSARFLLPSTTLSYVQSVFSPIFYTMNDCIFTIAIMLL